MVIDYWHTLMLSLQRISGPHFEEFIAERIASGDPLTEPIARLPLGKCVAYTYAPSGSPLAINRLEDFHESIFRDISVIDEYPIVNLAHQFLVDSPTRILFARFGFSKGQGDTSLSSPELPYVFVDAPEWTGVGEGEKMVYLFIPSAAATLEKVDRAFRYAMRYPMVLILTSMPPSVDFPAQGAHLTKENANALAERASYLLVGAFDEETQIVCELPPRLPD